MRSYSKSLSEVEYQKWLFWQKVLSSDAMVQNWSAIFDGYDINTFLYDFNVTRTLLAWLAFCFDFGFDFEELDLLQLLSELYGVSLDTIFPEFDDFLKRFRFLQETGLLLKGQYGVTCYDESIYDPPLFRAYFTHFSLAVMMKRGERQTKASKLLSVGEVCDVAEEWVETAYNVCSLFSRTLEQVAYADASWADFSRLGPESSGTQVVFSDIYGEEYSLDQVAFLDYITYAWADLSRADLCFAAVETEEELAAIQSFLHLTAKLTLAFGLKAQANLPASPLHLANYQTPIETVERKRSYRMADFDEGRTLMRSLGEQVKRALNGRGLPLFDQRAYVSAVLDLASTLAGERGWGVDLFKQMSESQVVAAWLESWTKRGLDRQTLEDLYRYLSSTGSLQATVSALRRKRATAEVRSRTLGSFV